MKKLFFILFAIPALVLAQSEANKSAKVDVYIPRTLSAGTLMSARTLSTSLDDTTQGFSVRGFNKVFVGIESATNDSVRIILQYAQSKDGVNFSNYVAWDSLSNTGTVGKVKYFEAPADIMGAHSVRVRVFSNSDVLRQSANPSTTITTKIIRKP